MLFNAQGRAVYIGARDGALPYFMRLGYHCPPQTNPAEFLVDLVSVDRTTEEVPTTPLPFSSFPFLSFPPLSE